MQYKNVANKPNDQENLSFTMNIFRGNLETKQVFPFPDILNKDQRETLQMLVDPVEKFFEVCYFLTVYYLL